MKNLEKKVEMLIRLCTAEDETSERVLRDELRCFSLPVVSEPTIQSRICRVLRDLGVPEHLSGYIYLVEAVEMVIQDRSYLRRITSGLYPDVARKYQSTATRTERAIRHAIETAWSRCDLDTLSHYFGNTVSPAKGKPVNSEFIARVSSAVLQEA